jgi:hypothetical protein
LRRVRADGTILFQRGWWKAPDDWIGKDVWVHECTDNSPRLRGREYGLEAAPPGMHIYDARLARQTVMCPRSERADAKPGYRKADHIAWAARSRLT